MFVFGGVDVVAHCTILVTRTLSCSQLLLEAGATLCLYLTQVVVCFASLFLRRWAREVMALLELEPGVLMRDVFTPRLSEIYRGTKVRHLGELRKNSGVPYEDMIFFDDWDQNCKDVGKLGVTCIECPRVRLMFDSRVILRSTVWRS